MGKRYFCLCLGGIKSDSDASVAVESFQEIKMMLDNCLEELGKKFTSYETQHIIDKSPEKFPHWGKTYMVVGIEQKGGRIPLGYCNFAKTKANSVSMLSVLLFVLFFIAFTMSVVSIVEGHYDAALWCFNCAVLTSVLKRMRTCLVSMKLSYLLK